MKRTVMALAALMALLSHPAFAGVTIGKIIGLAEPKIESPLLQQLGISVRGINVDVLNNTPFAGVLYVYGKRTATIKPGDVAHGKIHFEPLNSQVPIVVLFYQDESLGRYQGAAAQIFNVSVFSPVSFQWTIQSGEIRTPDRSHIQLETYPGVQVGFEKENAFDRNWWDAREWWNATAGVQVVNNTFFRAAVLVNGEKRTELEPGELAFVYVRNYAAASGYTETIQLVFTDQGFLRGSWETTLCVPSEGVIMYQHIINSYDIRR